MTTEEKIIKNKLGLIKPARTPGNISQTCKVMRYSRDSFYRFKGLYDKSGAEGTILRTFTLAFSLAT